MKKVAADYFKELFSTTSPSEFDNFLTEVTLDITPQMNQRLVRLATKEEVKEALFMMHPEKGARTGWHDISIFPTHLAYY